MVFDLLHVTRKVLLGRKSGKRDSDSQSDAAVTVCMVYGVCVWCIVHIVYGV